MGMNMQGRPTRPNETTLAPPAPRFGPKGLLQDEPLIFELDGWDRTGVDLPEPEGAPSDDLSGLLRDAPIGLPGVWVYASQHLTSSRRVQSRSSPSPPTKDRP